MDNMTQRRNIQILINTGIKDAIQKVWDLAEDINKVVNLIIYSFIS